MIKAPLSSDLFPIVVGFESYSGNSFNRDTSKSVSFKLFEDKEEFEEYKERYGYSERGYNVWAIHAKDRELMMLENLWSYAEETLREG